MSAVRRPERARRARQRGASGRPSAALAALGVAATLTVVLAVVVGCGKKGPPYPPPRLIPAQTTDLTVRQTGDRLVLELAYPAVTTSGLPLAGIEALEVLALRPPPTAPGAAAVSIDPRTFGATGQVVKRLEAADLMAATRGARLVVELAAAPGSPLGPRPEDERAGPGAPPAVDPPATAPDSQSPPVAANPPGSPATQPAAAVAPAETAPAATPGATPSGAPEQAPGATPAAAASARSATPTATPAPPGPAPMLIAIRTFGPRGNESPLSNLVAILPRTPPAPPESLVATGTAGGVQVTWSANAGAAAGFDLLRRTGEGAFEARVAQVGPDRLEHLDATATFGDRYEYTVRTVAARDPVVESVDGPIAGVDYQDTFAPPTPGGLVALAEAGRIRLLWDRVEAPDLADYRLYRQENDGEEIELERPPAAGNDHADDQVRTGAIYTYRVTAVDRGGNESARSEPVTATPR